MTITARLHARLAADATLTALLATYKGEPAIFTADPVPNDAKLPFVVVSGIDSDDDYGWKNQAGRDVRRRIRGYTRATGSVDQVEAIALRIRALLHRQPLVLADGVAYVVDVRGPENAPADPDIYGRSLTVRLLTQTT